MNTQAGLRILLLGTPLFMSGEQPVEIPGRLQRNLLCYLACQNGPVPRERIVSIFWPEELEPEGRKRLHETLSKLRSSLGASDPLVGDNDWLALDENKVYVDAREFQRLSNQVGRELTLMSRHPLPQSVYEQALRAVKLWRSAEFMTGANQPYNAEFDRWLSEERADFQTSRRALLERLAKHERDTGDLEASRRWLNLALKDDEYNADLQYEMLSVLIELGRRSDADQYCSYLDDLFGSTSEDEFPPELRTLMERIRSQVNAPQRTYRTIWPAALNLQIPFVGREDILKAMQQRYLRGGVIAIYGEAGSGKSRLLHEFYHSAEPAARLIWVSPTPSRANLPYDALTQALRNSIQDEEWKQLDIASATRLSLLLPDLIMIRPGVQFNNQNIPREARPLLFEAIYQLLHMLASKQRLLLYLDDAQWCDPDTLDALTYTLERVHFRGNGLLVIASRLEERSQHLEGFLSHFRTAAEIPQIELPLLNPAEVGTLAKRALGIDPPPEFVDRLSRETGGNALFLVETLRSIMDVASSPENLTPARLPLASSMTALVRERLLLMKPATQQVLYAAAVLGSEFTPELLENTTEYTPAAVVDALEELERLRLVRPTPVETWTGSYCFVHEKIREILMLNLSTARKRLLHTQAARALEQFSALTIPSAMIASHYEAAGDNGNAARYWMKAAARARRFFSLEEATRIYKKAEQLTLEVNQTEMRQLQYALYSAWGDLALEMVDPQTLEHCSNVLQQIGYFLNEARMIGTGLMQQGQALYFRKRRPESVAAYDQALEYLRKADSLPEHLRTLNWRGIAMLDQGRFEEASQSYCQAVDLGAGSSDLAVAIETLNAKSYLVSLRFLRGQMADAEAMAADAVLQSQHLSSNFLNAQASSILASTQLYNGKLELAVETAYKGLEISTPLQNWWLIAFNHYIIGRACGALGRLDQAWSHLQTSLELSEKFNYFDILAESLAAKAEIHRLLSAYPKAIETCQQALQSSLDSQHRLDVLYQLGFATGITDPAQGLALLGQAIQEAEAFQFGLVAIPSRAARALLLCVYGQHAAAEEDMRYLESLPHSGLATAPFILSIARARTALQQGSPAQAQQLMESSLPRLEKLASPWMLLYTYELLVQALRAQGLPHSEPLQRSRALLEQIAAGTQNEPLRSEFLAFREKIENSWLKPA